jgi:hypothetical protein
MQPCSDPIWHQRANMLLLLLPADIKELLRRASTELRWPGDLTRNVIAWGDGRVFVERIGKWCALRGAHGQKTNARDKKEETVQAQDSKEIQT